MSTTIKIGEWTFDHVDYDAGGDVLYLSIGEPRDSDGVQTPEGHGLHYDIESGELCGITLISPAYLMREQGKLEITIPTKDLVPSEPLRELVAC